MENNIEESEKERMVDREKKKKQAKIQNQEKFQRKPIKKLIFK